MPGTGVPPADFTTSSPTSPQSVRAGGAASYLIMVTSTTGNYNLPVLLAATGLPSGATVSFAPGIVTPGTAGANSIMTVQTAARVSVLKRDGETGPAPRGFKGWLELVSTGIMAFVLCTRRLPRIRNRQRLLTIFGGLLLLSLGVSACGGGFPGHPAPTPSPLPAPTDRISTPQASP